MLPDTKPRATALIIISKKKRIATTMFKICRLSVRADVGSFSGESRARQMEETKINAFTVRSNAGFAMSERQKRRNGCAGGKQRSEKSWGHGFTAVVLNSIVAGFSAMRSCSASLAALAS